MAEDQIIRKKLRRVSPAFFWWYTRPPPLKQRWNSFNLSLSLPSPRQEYIPLPISVAHTWLNQFNYLGKYIFRPWRCSGWKWGERQRNLYLPNNKFHLKEVWKQFSLAFVPVRSHYSQMKFTKYQFNFNKGRLNLNTRVLNLPNHNPWGDPGGFQIFSSLR